MLCDNGAIIAIVENDFFDYDNDKKFKRSEERRVGKECRL